MNNVVSFPRGGTAESRKSASRKLPAGQRLLIIVGMGVASWAMVIGAVAELAR